MYKTSIALYKYCYMIIKVQIYIDAPSVELLLPTLKSFTSHVKTGNFDQIYNLKNKKISLELC